MSYKTVKEVYGELPLTKSTPEFLYRMSKSISGIVPVKRKGLRLAKLNTESSPETKRTLTEIISKG